MPRKKRTAVQYTLAGDVTEAAGVTVIHLKEGDGSFIDALRQVGTGFIEHTAKLAMQIDPSDARSLRRANRGRNSGQSKQIGVRFKADDYPSVERRAEELGVTVAEYVRMLVYADIGVTA